MRFIERNEKISHLLSTNDFTGSVADYSARLGCKPEVVVAGRYALWRNDLLNFSISCKEGQKGGQVAILALRMMAKKPFAKSAMSMV
jgi:hypothetical protein